jgi:hypothetical protein
MENRAQAGNSVLLLIFGLFLLGLVGGGIFLLSPSQSDQGNRAAEEARAAYDEAVAALDRALNDPRNMQDSVERNHSSFECLYRPSGECRGRGGAFLLYDVSQANRPLSHLAKDGGMDSLGRPCKGYPSVSCPLRVETVWEPVCADTRCENTNSVTVKAKVSLVPLQEGALPMEWTRDALFSPQIALSGAASCERGGGVWANTECLTQAQASERQLASTPNGGAAQPVPADAPPPEQAVEQAQVPVQYECPNQIVVYGQYFDVAWLAADRGQVSVPSQTCPPGVFDVFVFQCAAKNPATFPNEGQWIQVEAVMAPPCDQYGNPVANEGARL